MPDGKLCKKANENHEGEGKGYSASLKTFIAAGIRRTISVHMRAIYNVGERRKRLRNLRRKVKLIAQCARLTKEDVARVMDAEIGIRARFIDRESRRTRRLPIADASERLDNTGIKTVKEDATHLEADDARCGWIRLVHNLVTDHGGAIDEAPGKGCDRANVVVLHTPCMRERPQVEILSCRA